MTLHPLCPRWWSAALLILSSTALVAGQGLLKDINQQPAANPDSTPTNIVAAGAFACFAATERSVGCELFRTDGTSSGTTMIRDLEPGLVGSAPTDFTVIGSTVFFTATTTLHGTELWMTDGTVAGTALVLDIGPGAASGAPTGLTALGGTLFFSADDPTSGRELWRSDGTAAGRPCPCSARRRS